MFSVHLYDSSEVCGGEGGGVVIDVRDFDVDQCGSGHRWSSSIHSSDGQRVTGNLKK